jgi:hypothetical protein
MEESVRYRRMMAAFLLFMGMLAGVSLSGGTAFADSPPYYAPTQGEIVTAVDGDNYALTASFWLSPEQLGALQETAQYLEFDFPVYNITMPGDSSSYGVYGNLPGAQHDVDFHNGTFTPSATMIKTSDLQANTHYWVTVKFQTQATGGVPMMSAQFVPSRWANPLNPKEAGACEVRAVTGNPAWCVFPVEGARVWMTYGLVPIVDNGHYSLDPGLLDLVDIA